jgi:hypothetical protein
MIELTVVIGKPNDRFKTKRRYTTRTTLNEALRSSRYQIGSSGFSWNKLNFSLRRISDFFENSFAMPPFASSRIAVATSTLK